MRKILIWLPVAFLILTVSSFAQDAEYAPFEVFGGYNFVRSMNGGIGGVGCADVVGVSCPLFMFGAGEDGKNMNGWDAAFTGNLNSRFGVKVEVSGVYPTFNNIVNFSGSSYSFMVGPQINKQVDGGRLFGHALFGLNRYTIDVRNMDNRIYASDSCNSFAMAFGGGLDWGKGRFAIRAPQVDYFPWVNSYNNGNDSNILNNIRISTGIVFRFGN
jgi:hypothetical protein